MIPELPTITEGEIFQMTGWTPKTLNAKTYSKSFPKKITMSKKLGKIYSREAVYRALGISANIDNSQDGFNNV